MLSYGDEKVAIHECISLEPLGSILEVTKSEYSKGYAKGVRDILAIPAQQVDICRDTKLSILKIMEEKDA